MEDRVNAEVDRAREEIRNEMENEKKREIDVALKEMRIKFEADVRRMKDELNRFKVS
jgi:hypothetical protein